MSEICKICGKEFKDIKSLIYHLANKKIKSKDYYDKYIKTEFNDKCKQCNKETKFKSLLIGYDNFCNIVCKNKYDNNEIDLNNKHQCRICTGIYKNLGNHLRSSENITPKNYYDKYIKSDQESKCLTCGKETKFIGVLKGYNNFCSNKCVQNSEITKNSRIKTCQDRMGVDNPFQAESSKEKSRETKFEKYGDPTFTNTDKAVKTSYETINEDGLNIYETAIYKNKQTKFDNHGDPTYTNRNQIEQTNLIKFGSKSPLGNKDIIKKCKHTQLNNIDDEGLNGYQRKGKYLSEFYKNKPEEFYKDRNVKTKATKLERYDDPNYNNMNQIELTNLDRYGYKCVLSSPIIQQKSKDTYLKLYNVEYPAQVPKIMEKIGQTNLKKFGNKCPMRNDKIQEDIKQKLIDKFGVDNAWKSPIIRIKIKETMNELYDCDYPIQNVELKNKIKQTMNELYGVDYAMQNEDLFSKQQSSAFSNKDYILPSGKIVEVQGYENKYLDEYFTCSDLEENIIVQPKEKDIGKILYNTDDGREHRYFPDFYIKDKNLIVEVKSTYTIGIKPNINILKEKACRDAGYKFQFAIMI